MKATALFVEDELKRLMDASMEEAASVFGGLDNPDLYIDGQRPVDIIQFVEDPVYLGGLAKADPEVLQLLYLIEKDSVREAFVEVGKGSGKSFVGAITPIYGAYKILCMRKPHAYFGLTEDTMIATINVSVGLLQAKNVIFKQMKGLATKSPWFAKQQPIPLTQSVEFSGRNVSLYCGHSNSTAFLGFATLRAVLDEANFMVNNANRNVAQDLFGALKGSCKTRFKDHYKIVSISSAGTPNSWLHGEIRAITKAGTELPLIPGGIKPGYGAREEQQDCLDDVFSEDLFNERA